MPRRYPGGRISKTAPTPTGPFETGTAPGIWSLEEQAQFVKQGIWPTAGLVPNYIEDVFSTYLYTGTGASTFPVSNGVDLAGKGGLVWFKERSGTFGHILIDSARGINKYIKSQDTAAEVTNALYITSFNSNGYTAGVNENELNKQFVSWTFRKQPKFFDVVTYTGNGGTNNISHNLQSIPGCIIIKSTSTTGDWAVICRDSGGLMYYHYFSKNTNGLNSNGAGAGPYDSTAIINSTTFNAGALQDTGGSTNQNGVSYVAYLYAHDAGGFGLTGTDNVISCGSFTTGSGGKMSAPVNLGYEPQWLMVKNSGASENWQLYDTMRGLSFSGYRVLCPNLSNAEDSDFTPFVPTATGFDTPTASGPFANFSNYIYIAIRRGPMKVPTSGTSVFDATANAGTGSTKFITTNFPVDLTIQSNRNDVISHFTDRLRGGGANASPRIYSQFTDAETKASAGRGINFDSNTGVTNLLTYNNGVGDNFIYYAIRRAPSFFDEVCYTGNGTIRTLNHNLGVTPELMIFRGRNITPASTNGWTVYAAPLGNTKYFYLNKTNAAGTFTGYWNNTTPTASVFTLGVGNAEDTNADGKNFVAYLFATCAGVSKVGSYTGNGTTQTINCGFTGGARFVMIKRTDAAGGWYVYDTARGMTTLTDPYLFLNSAAAESATLGSVTTVSTGFALNSTILADINVSGGTYIFLAIA